MSTSRPMNVIWITNCSAYREPMTSHAHGGLAGNRQASALIFGPSGLGLCACSSKCSF